MAQVKIGALCWNQYTEWPALLAAGVRADGLGFATILDGTVTSDNR
jgi:hypothetical protein